MALKIGIRREDKNEWERRVPLVPADVARLRSEHQLDIVVQPSAIRVYPDESYTAVGARLSENIDSADLVLAVKEIPTELLLPQKVYVYFSHVIKGQAYNMPMLRRLMELGCSLVDYEKIADANGRRLIFFSLHAGFAGMIESLWSFGKRLEARGQLTPFADVKHAYEYDSLSAAKEHLARIGRRFAAEAAGTCRTPVVFGVSGYGNCSRGAQEILEALGVEKIEVGELPEASQKEGGPRLLAVVFKEEDMVRPRDAGATFELHDYYQNPERYKGCFEEHLPFIDVLVNTIYWEDRYPRLVTRDWVQRNYREGKQPRLQIIGDISCDIGGSIEVTRKTTQPDEPCYIADPSKPEVVPGCHGNGPGVMAVDNLPCELPREASQHFSTALRDMVPHLANASWEESFESIGLPDELKRAVILHKGRLTPDYEYLEQYLEG